MRPARSKPKPSDPTQTELESATRILAKIGERTGRAYEGSKVHVGLIVRQLRAGRSEWDLRAIVAWCWGEWEPKAEMHKYLRPETLFGPETVERYLPDARAWLRKNHPDKLQPPADLFERKEAS